MSTNVPQVYSSSERLLTGNGLIVPINRSVVVTFSDSLISRSRTSRPQVLSGVPVSSSERLEPNPTVLDESEKQILFSSTVNLFSISFTTFTNFRILHP